MTTAQVGLWLKAGNSYEQLNEQATSPVNAEGGFEINCLPPRAQYLVYASAKGYGKGQRQLQPEYDSNRVELATFVLKHADRVIAGIVTKENDKPASGVTVQLSGEGQPDGYLTTDSQGRFHFQVCAGEIRLFAYSQNGGGNAQAAVEAGDTNIVMTLSSQPGIFPQTPRPPASRCCCACSPPASVRRATLFINWRSRRRRSGRKKFPSSVCRRRSPRMTFSMNGKTPARFHSRSGA